MLTQITTDQETRAIFIDCLTLYSIRAAVARVRKIYKPRRACHKLAKELRARFWIRHIGIGIDPLAETLLTIAFRRTDWRLIAQTLLEGN
jgi:hypothetical protein